MTDKIRNAINDKVSKVLAVPPEIITEQLELSSIGLDSIKTIVLVVELEEMFGIAFADQELLYEYFSRLDRITSLVSNKLAAK